MAPPPTREAMRAEIERLVAENPVLLFMKGSPDHPECGFSAAAAQLLVGLGQPFAHKHATEQSEFRYVLAAYSQFATLPQTFVGGELIGGSDALHALHATGELERRIAAAFGPGEATPNP